ncbi:MAG: rhodanese-like domain-containing protein [Candidatus Limivicinus sp.]
MDRVSDLIPDRETPLYVYCRSGARSGQALALLQQMGYRKAKNIGGIIAWKGKVER